MKHLFMTIAMAAALTACGHRASTDNATDVDSTSTDSTVVATNESSYVLKTDSISMAQEDSTVSVNISIDWPMAGLEVLVGNIRQYISEEMATSIGDEKPKAVLSADGHKVLAATFNRYQHDLTRMRREAQQEGYSEGMQYSYNLHIYLLEANEHYVTYQSNAEGFLGGAHGFATASAQSFSAATGQRIGYETKYNFEKEAYEISHQTLFKTPLSPKLYALIKEGVRGYFKEFDNNAPTDEELHDLLIGVDNVNRIPLPSSAPAFTKNGLSFVYQQYEIAPYAAGMVNFNLPYDKVLPYLAKEAAEMAVSN